MNLHSPSKEEIDIAATIINESSPAAASERASPSPEDVGRLSLACEGAGCSQGFGVSLDLSRFFADERARCLVWVSTGAGAAEAGRVRALVVRLCARLPLPAPDHLVLLAPLGLLHPDDPLALLRPYDTVRVVPVERSPFLDQCAAEANCDNATFEENRFNDNQNISVCVSEPHVCVSDPPMCVSEPQVRVSDPPMCVSEPHVRVSDPPICVNEAHVRVSESPRCVRELPVCAGGGATALHEMKQRALGLLAQYSPSPASSPAPSPRPTPTPAPLVSPPRARRRRVRRRRRPTPSGTDDTDAPMHKIPRPRAAAAVRSDSEESGAGCRAEQGPGCGGGANGAGQGCQRQRQRPAHAARLVRAL